MSTEQELQQLIEGCLKGDSRSQHAIYKMYYGKMKAVCLRYANNVDEAKDILQEGFIRVFTQLNRYNGKGSFEGWMRRIMVNLSIDYYRKKKHFSTIEIENNLQLADDMDDLPDKGESQYDFEPHEIIEAMQHLSPVYRTVFNLYVFEEFTHQDIADKLGISIGTSKSNYAKAKKNMKKILLKLKASANE